MSSVNGRQSIETPRARGHGAGGRDREVGVGALQVDVDREGMGTAKIGEGLGHRLQTRSAACSVE